MTQTTQQRTLAFRLPEPLIKRLDTLAKQMSQPGMELTRTDVLRRAAHLGVEKLESEQKKSR